MIKIYELIGDKVKVKEGGILSLTEDKPSETLLSTEVKIYGMKATVSTIFMIFNHNFMNDEQPINFETMIFTDDFEENYQSRYHSLENAILGHNEAVIYIASKMRNLYEVKNQ